MSDIRHEDLKEVAAEWNLDERIDNIVDKYAMSKSGKQHLKQLLTDVLEYVKPSKLVWDDSMTYSKEMVYSHNVALEIMEAKMKELGL